MGCFNDEVLFIHIPKTGGTAVKEAMWKQLPGMQGQQPATPGVQQKADAQSPFPIGHMRLADVEHILGRPASSFRHVVAVLRNPYVQTVSQWLFWQGRYQRGGRHEHDLAAAAYPTIHGFLEDPRCDFHRWYGTEFTPRQPMAENPSNLYKDFGGTYLWWLTGQDGKLPENLTLLRMEQLQSDLAEFSARNLRTVLQLDQVNVGGWKQGQVMDYLVHRDSPQRSLRALDLVEAKFRWAFGLHYRRVDRAQFLQQWAQAGLL